jgi:potassium-transporting ATPase potassium-binding subunit
MTSSGWLQILLYFAVLVLLTKPLGLYMARVFGGEPTLFTRVLRPIERQGYRLMGVDPAAEMGWSTYAVAALMLGAASVLLLYLIQRAQGWLPLNPLGFGAVPPALALNTAVSFVTNTNWQNYGGENTLSFFTQMAGLTVQNFVSAGVGIAVAVAFIRGLARHKTDKLGNFWVDLTRAILYVLLPLSLLVALVLVSQGVVQTFTSTTQVAWLQPGAAGDGAPAVQSLALGPVASQVAIKHLGTNGGGFFNANAAHPFENPTPLTDFVLVLSETVIAAALTYTFGKMVGDTRQGWSVLTAMLLMLALFVAVTFAAESAGNPHLATLGVDQRATTLQGGGNMEGKEVRFGMARSGLFVAATTATSTGAVNSAHDSLTPIGGLSALLLMGLGEVALGGVGSGLYGMLIFVLIAVFVAGLMVGRTPEYLGKKVETFEMKMAAILILIVPMLVLAFTALAVVTEAGRAGVFNPGPHGFSEILYAFMSQGNNNGSAFAGLSGNSDFYNLAGGLVMLAGRYWLIVPTLALAGSLARKGMTPAGAGTLPTHQPLFVGWLIGIIILVSALNFVPALALGPIVEQLLR